MNHLEMNNKNKELTGRSRTEGSNVYYGRVLKFHSFLPHSGRNQRSENYLRKYTQS